MPVPFISRRHFEDYKQMHETTGCYDCFFAAKDKLGNNPCCTRAGPMMIDVNSEGRCQNRK